MTKIKSVDLYFINDWNYLKWRGYLTEWFELSLVKNCANFMFFKFVIAGIGFGLSWGHFKRDET